MAIDSNMVMFEREPTLASGGGHEALGTDEVGSLCVVVGSAELDAGVFAADIDDSTVIVAFTPCSMCDSQRQKQCELWGCQGGRLGR